MISLQELNTLTQPCFTALLGGVFEHSPWVAEQTWSQRPFGTFGQLHAALCRTVQNTSAEQKLALIRAHPDLGNRLTLLTPASAAEQAAAGLTQMGAGEAARFHELNARYKARFGFPFIVCARLNDVPGILDAFARRLGKSPDEEINTALGEIEKIARLRLEQIVSP